MNILKECLNQVGKANKVSSTTNKLKHHSHNGWCFSTFTLDKLSLYIQ
jgi:hypothetical protein